MSPWSRIVFLTKFKTEDCGAKKEKYTRGMYQGKVFLYYAQTHLLNPEVLLSFSCFMYLSNTLSHPGILFSASTTHFGARFILQVTTHILPSQEALLPPFFFRCLSTWCPSFLSVIGLLIFVYTLVSFRLSDPSSQRQWFFHSSEHSIKL